MARDLGFLVWDDPLAGLENMESDLFHSTCHRENKWHSELMKEPHIQSFIKSSQKFKTYLEENRRIKKYFKSGSLKFDVDTMNGSTYIHLPGMDPLGIEYFTASSNGEHIALLIDESEGLETYTLHLYELTEKTAKLLYKRNNVGDSIGFVGNRIYYTAGKQYHIYDTLYSASVTDGSSAAISKSATVSSTVTNKADTRKIFKIEPTEKQYIIQTSTKIFLKVLDYANSKIYEITHRGLEPIRQVGIYDQIIGGTDIIYYDTHINHYKSLHNVKLPHDERPIWYSAKHMIVQTIADGIQKLWSVAPDRKPELMLSTQVPGNIQIDPYANAADANVLRFIMRCVDREPLLGTISRTEVRMAAQPAANGLYYPRLAMTRLMGKSADGTKVPGIIVKPKGGQDPINLLVYCYGAYAYPTNFSPAYQTYYPLLQTGRWAIAFVMPRGGGDRSFEWIHAGRKLNRKYTVDDYEAVIKAAQEELGITPKNTVLYGRSAGGIPVGMMIARYPRGQLFKAAWLEAPFVDVLRSLTDLSQPLSLNESEEFGNPAAGPAEFKMIADQSPINNLPHGGITNMNVILRTGENDRQVYAFEPVKYAQKLRGLNTVSDMKSQKNPAGIYLFCGKKEGHFYSKTTALDARIEDMAALDFFVDA